MAARSYDIITVGGGIAASTLAKAMAGRGAKVLVLEREKQFKDRVRGEAVVPWGVAEANELGLCSLLKEKCAHEVPHVEAGSGLRDLRTTREVSRNGLRGDRQSEQHSVARPFLQEDFWPEHTSETGPRSFRSATNANYENHQRGTCAA
jgi:2-polyprenyl-6-methoxyphenol hydroxylase-like FAD-dependent oxidoreductase